MFSVGFRIKNYLDGYYFSFCCKTWTNSRRKFLET